MHEHFQWEESCEGTEKATEGELEKAYQGNRLVLAEEGCPRVCQVEHRLKWQGKVQVKKAAESREAGGLDGHSFKRSPLVMTTL